MLTTTNDKARVHPASPHHRGRPWRNDCSRHVCKITYPKSLMQGSLWPRLLRAATIGPRNPHLPALHRR